MAPKGADARVDGMEKDLEKLKSEMQRLPTIECNIEQLTHGMTQLFSVMEETQRSIVSLMAATLKTNRENQNGGASGAMARSSTPRVKQLENLMAFGGELGRKIPTTEGGSQKVTCSSEIPIERSGVVEACLGRKLDMPVFSGDNPEGWVFRAERYFHLNQLTGEERLMADIVCLDEDALSWFS